MPQISTSSQGPRSSSVGTFFHRLKDEMTHIDKKYQAWFACQMPMVYAAIESAMREARKPHSEATHDDVTPHKEFLDGNCPPEETRNIHKRRSANLSSQLSTIACIRHTAMKRLTISISKEDPFGIPKKPEESSGQNGDRGYSSGSWDP